MIAWRSMPARCRAAMASLSQLSPTSARPGGKCTGRTSTSSAMARMLHRLRREAVQYGDVEAELAAPAGRRVGHVDHDPVGALALPELDRLLPVRALLTLVDESRRGQDRP